MCVAYIYNSTNKIQDDMPRTANRVVSNLSSRLGEGYVDWEDGAGLVLCSTLDLLSSFSEKKEPVLKEPQNEL